MAITTLDGIVAGLNPPQQFSKSATPTLVIGRPHSLFYLAGNPGAATAPSPGVAGAALTSYGGQLRFSNPGSGNTHLARLTAIATATNGILRVCDRLWHNSGLNVTTSPAAQTVNSAAWPARDIAGSTNGDGVLVGLEVSAATGSGTPTLTLNYTNQAGAGSKSSTNIQATAASSAIGAFYELGLQAGDTGVRSIQSFAFSATWTSGTVHLVAYRILAEIPLSSNQPFSLDAFGLGLPQLFDNTVPFLIYVPGGTSASTISGGLNYAQG